MVVFLYHLSYHFFFAVGRSPIFLAQCLLFFIDDPLLYACVFETHHHKNISTQTTTEPFLIYYEIEALKCGPCYYEIEALYGDVG